MLTHFSKRTLKMLTQFVIDSPAEVLDPAIRGQVMGLSLQPRKQEQSCRRIAKFSIGD